MTNFLASSGILLMAILLAFGFGYYAKQNDLPVPPIIRGYIPDPGNSHRAPEDKNSQGSNQRVDRIASEDKYVLPIGVSTNEFANCLKSRALPLIEGRDFNIKERSSLVRILIPIAREDIVSTGYEDCRSRFVNR